MEVKPGYKQTEVGVIPEEWEFGRLARCSSSSTDVLSAGEDWKS